MQKKRTNGRHIIPMLLSVLSILSLPVMAHHSGMDRLVTSAATVPQTAAGNDPAIDRAVNDIKEIKQSSASTVKTAAPKKERRLRFHAKPAGRMLILGGAEAFPMYSLAAMQAL